MRQFTNAFRVGVVTIAAWAATWLASPYGMAASPSILDSAKLIVGTSDHGHTFPGACYAVWHGATQPRHATEGWDACGGYHYTDSTILGFSHNHFTGTGCPELGNILFLTANWAGKGRHRPAGTRPPLYP